MKKEFLVISGLCLLILAAFTPGCSTDPAAIPTYVRIDTIYVDSTNYDSTGSTNHKVNLAWVYFDDNLQGVYTLPAKFPVIGEGPRKIEIFAGVYEFGNGSTATRYIFYESWKMSDTLVAGDTVTYAPHVRYIDDFKVQFNQDFNDGGNQTLDRDADASSPLSSFIHAYNVEQFEGPVGYLYLGQDEVGTKLVVESAVPMTVPKNKLGYFIEMNYRCNTPFTLDIKTSQQTRNVVGFNKKETWNKAYINLTNAIDAISGTDVRFVFTVNQDTNIVNQEVFIDNLKLMYR